MCMCVYIYIIFICTTYSDSADDIKFEKTMANDDDLCASGRLQTIGSGRIY